MGHTNASTWKQNLVMNNDVIFFKRGRRALALAFHSKFWTWNIVTISLMEYDFYDRIAFVQRFNKILKIRSYFINKSEKNIVTIGLILQCSGS